MNQAVALKMCSPCQLHAASLTLEDTFARYTLGLGVLSIHLVRLGRGATNLN
jgi:hypothetical protein